MKDRFRIEIRKKKLNKFWKQRRQSFISQKEESKPTDAEDKIKELQIIMKKLKIENQKLK